MSLVSHKALDQHHKDLIRVRNDIQIVVAGNKCDVKKKDLKVKGSTFQRQHRLRHYEMSIKFGKVSFVNMYITLASRRLPLIFACILFKIEHQ